ncbi:dienelactone hydrolase family protein [Hydrogenophaga sp. H7]|uniref:dienelactone hydrolase family protein n=1 Tax=Hydrogenophaga sp. H7 TaxID=1882399 RepID=UPI0009A41CA9|nr:dienelactone hydrolase family protein [Hydrogenophaga sp. H7]OPF63083.1 carboxymethylenebutenolidase [Hydrogenophaga sp. H7]
MSSFVQLTSADGFHCPAYVAQPAGQPKGGLVVLQEIFGVNSHIQAVADGYAADGYFVVAPSTFHRVKAGVDLGYTESDMGAGMALKTAVEALPPPGVMADIQAAIRLAAQGGKVGIVGYCWGGLLTWRSACMLQGLSAAVPYYGGGMTTPEEMARQEQVPTLAHFAEQDRWIPLDGVEAFRQAHPAVTVHLYPAHHGFNCDQRGAWDAPSAALARERTLAFFSQHLG